MIRQSRIGTSGNQDLDSGTRARTRSLEPADTNVVDYTTTGSRQWSAYQLRVRSASGGASTQEARSERAGASQDRAVRSSKGPKATPEQRYAVQKHAERLIVAGKGLEAAAKEGDFVGQGLAGDEYRRALSDLWRLRHARDNDDWSSLVNMLQGALADLSLEALSPHQCEALRHLAEDSVRIGSLSRDDVRAAKRRLREVGLDPLRAISAKSGSESDEPTH